MNNDNLRRYTNLPSLLYMLTKKKITLLDPDTWDDKNDSWFLDIYTEEKKLQKTLALCMTRKNETYHHWSVFTSRENGVCIVFDYDKLVAHLNRQKGIIHGLVRYMTLDKMRKNNIDIDELPFLKRYAFTDETEYRIIYPSTENISVKNISLPVDAIKKISINPWAPKTLFEAVREVINNIDGCENIKVGHSSLVNNKEWCKIGSRIKTIIEK
ncbi:hypothetical protein DMA29_20965 [Salmonella enterica subsp. enterica serovar Seattle]|nr:hypothetical protein [Salmonella enterica subsp. enterica serovar Seattle]EDW4492479.1 DUF2971 domain-containing protein [Salmonella enterica subsp. enterica]